MRTDLDQDYCEPAHLPGEEVMVLETGELVTLRLVLPIALEGRLARFLYVGERGAWTGGEITSAGRGRASDRSPDRRPS